MGRRISFANQFRRAIERSGLSRYRICKELGIEEPTLHRFMHRVGGIRLDKFCAIADLLKLSIEQPPQRQSPTPPRTRARRATRRKAR